MERHIRKTSAALLCCFILLTLVTALTVEGRPNNIDSPDSLPQEVQITPYSIYNELRFEVVFPKPEVTEINGFHAVEMGSLAKTRTPGEPVLPYKTINVLIPQGQEIKSLEVTVEGKERLTGQFYIEYGRTPVHIGQFPLTVDNPKPALYSSMSPYPLIHFTQLSAQYLRGYKILPVTLYPIQYVPKMSELSYFNKMILTVHLEEKTEASPPLFRRLPEDATLVRSVVDNPETISMDDSPTPLQPIGVAPGQYDYVIITDATLNSSFQPLIDWKILKGLNATTVLVENITSDSDYFCDGLYGDGCASTFNDTQAQIRNFIKDAYTNWGTEYILLGGDVEIIPQRNLYGFMDVPDPPNQWTKKPIPSDLYYAGLDGNWDNDTDTIFGEGIYDAGPQNATAGDEADFLAEVYVGRASVSNPTEASNFVNKTLWYEQSSDDSYFKKATMVGEILDEETRGGNALDSEIDFVPQYSFTRLYQRDGTFSKLAIQNAINAGTHILGHDGHTNPTIMMEFTREEVDTLFTNTEYFFGYSVGCDCAAFEVDDSIVEHWIKNPNGAFAFVANSRYGWYSPGSMYGAGERFAREFYNTLNNTVQNLGKTLQTSKENTALGGGSVSDVDRWTFYSLNLHGDPETELKTEIEAPTAHFETNPNADRMTPAVLKGLVDLTGLARRGTAPGSAFSNYTIDFGAGSNPVVWMTDGITLANNGQTPISGGSMATWDTNILTPGTRTLRLRVDNGTGVIGEDRWIVKIEELPAIRVSPELTETFEGLNFTISVEITDPEELFGLDFQMTWNNSILDYVSHEVYIPRDTYYWGILYSPVTITKDEVNQTTATYWIVANSSSYDPADRDGVVYNMTFHAKAAGNSALDIHSSNLTERNGTPIIHKIVNGTVEVAPGIHDCAVTDIALSTTMIGESYPANMNVTIANEGTFVETISFEVRANGTAFNTTQILLAGLTSETIQIVWDTTGWTKGNYTISVNVTQVIGETDLADNLVDDGNIFVTTAGDQDADGDVDIFDIVIIAGAYGTSEGDPGYVPSADIDGDGDVDIFDIVIAAGNYGKE